jgi:pyruvate formate lyase activating enzyme
MCRWIKDELGPDVPIHFARFYPLYKLANLPPTPVSTLDNARDIALEVGLEFVYVARVTGHKGENTFCPGCGEAVITRFGFVIDQMHLTGGKCEHCGAAITGRWQ